MSTAAKSGRRWAYLTLFLMLALSIAGNIAHTVHIDPSPSALSIIRAVIWPVGLFLAIEMFMRVPWEQKPAHHLVRWIGILLPAGLAALVSYRHLRGLMLSDGEGALEASVGPIVIDGLMLMATLGLLLTRPEAQKDSSSVVRTAARVVTGAVPSLTLAEVLPQPEPVRELSAWETHPVHQIPAPTHTLVQYGPWPEGWTPEKPERKQRASRRTGWDRELARKLIETTDQDDHQIGEQVGIGYKTIQRYRRDLAAIRTPEPVA